MGFIIVFPSILGQGGLTSCIVTSAVSAIRKKKNQTDMPYNVEIMCFRCLLFDTSNQVIWVYTIYY